MGTPNSEGARAPYFSFNFDNVGFDRVEAVFDDPNFAGINLLGSEVVVYAQAVIAPRSVAAAPSPLPLLGVAAAFGYNRKLRKRIKTHKLPDVVSAIG